MQSHVLVSSAQRHIKRFAIQRLRRNHNILRRPSLRFMRGHHPAVFECRVFLRQLDQFAWFSVRMKHHHLAGDVGYHGDIPVVNLAVTQVHVELNQIAHSSISRISPTLIKSAALLT